MEPSGGTSRSGGPFFDKLNLEIVFILVQSPGLKEASYLPEREESAVKRVLCSESAPPRTLSSQPPGKDNVFLQQLIKDRRTDSGLV